MAALRGTLGRERASARPLAPQLRGEMEGQFGHRFSDVRILTEGPAARATQAAGAKAATVGSTIAFAPGRFESGSDATRRTLAHELTHVVQQSGGEQRSGSGGSAEAEAEANADRVLAGRGASVSMRSPTGIPQLEPVDELNKKKALEKAKKEAKKSKAEGKAKIDRGFEKKAKKGEDPKNKFDVSAEIKVPIKAGQLGSLYLLKDLKLKTKGSAFGPDLIPMDSVRLTLLQQEIALTLMKLELPKVQLPHSSLSMGAALKGTGSLSHDLDSGKTSAAAGAKAEAKADLKSRPLRGPVPTLGGFLGPTAQVGLGANASFSTGIDSAKGPKSKFAGGGTLSLGGDRAFVELNFQSSVEADEAGKFKAKNTKFFFGGSVGFRFF